MKKNIITLALGASVFLLAGCGAKDVTTNPPMQKQAEKPAENPAVKKTMDTAEIKTPAPTGEVDNTVDAIISGADNEKLQATSDEADVKALTDDSAESNNLSNTYDQTNL
ncbi:MAG: hypothetical protein WC848_00975 [Parcubacteria group bacterium]|jgi:hypothetical protein